MDTGRQIAAAERAFAQLRESAIVASGMATWLQVSPGAGGTVGPSLYSGTAGIAWALAEFAQASGEGWAADLARCAITHALHHAPAIPANQRLGFHGGLAGITFSAARIALLLDGAALRRSAVELLSAMARTPPSAEFDLISGAAGAALAGGLLTPVYGDAAVAVAQRAAARLRETALFIERSGRRVAAWKPPGLPRALPLTGLAHGAAGVGWALLELWAHRPDDVWLTDLAEQAFAYEDSIFDSAEQNWPDLRHYHSWRAARLMPPPYQVAWCHGAAGIALSRLRAFEITGVTLFAKTAKIAGASVQRSVRDRAIAAEAPSGLCHGLAGNADVLETLRLRLGMSAFAPAVARMAEETTARVIGLKHDGGRKLLDPGLMLGTAGLGAFLLYAAGAIPASLLMPTLTTASRNSGRVEPVNCSTSRPDTTTRR